MSNYNKQAYKVVVDYLFAAVEDVTLENDEFAFDRYGLHDNEHSSVSRYLTAVSIFFNNLPVDEQQEVIVEASFDKPSVFVISPYSAIAEYLNIAPEIERMVAYMVADLASPENQADELRENG